MSQVAFPLIVQHMDACGLKDGRPVATSVLPAIAVLLVARGADRVMIPTPHARDRERAEAGISQLPRERRSYVMLCDTEGKVADQVQDYLEPLRRQARKWPEDAFVNFAENFLYEVAVASRQKAGILSSSASIVRDFIPLVDPMEFDGEARFRLAELFRMICSYEPEVVNHGQIRVNIQREGGKGIGEILRLAEFRSVVEASGRIGFLKHPILGLQRLQERLLALVRSPTVRPVLKLASTAADATGAGGLGGAAEEALGLAADSAGRNYHPPFISLGPAALPLYRAALREGAPGAGPPEGVIMLFERLRGGRVTRSWLNSGEEEKLEKEAQAGLEPRRRRFLEALEARGRIIG